MKARVEPKVEIEEKIKCEECKIGLGDSVGLCVCICVSVCVCVYLVAKFGKLCKKIVLRVLQNIIS